VQQGWRDVGLRVEGPLAANLGESFDDLFDRHNFKHPPLARFRPGRSRPGAVCETGEVLLAGPGLRGNEFKQRLLRDLATARRVQIAVGYFLPIGRVRRALLKACRRGAHVELVLPGKSDVALAITASRALYRRLLRAGAEVSEYAPQVLHSKLFVVDDAVYVGSSNLDPRSLHINYELMLRITDPAAVAGARAIFEDHLQHSRTIELHAWLAGRSWWARLKGRWACFLLGRLDRLLMARQLRRLPD
jgi:cardiolipin synthase